MRHFNVSSTQTPFRRQSAAPAWRLFACLGLAASIALALPAAAGEGKAGGRAKIDANGDGVIDRSEAAAHPRLAENFERMDKNQDGRIDASERPQRQGKGRDGRQGQRGERMAKLDSNGDGRFSREELAGRERALQNFTAIDSNNDGFLTREEMRAYHQKNGGRRGPAQN
jgi:hypothetical protein